MTKQRRAPSDEEIFPDLRNRGMIAVDCETKDSELKEKGSGAHKDDTFIAGVALGTELSGFRRYYPIHHEEGGNLDPAKVKAYVKVAMAIPVPKVGANLLYDIGHLHAEDMIDFDTIKKNQWWDVQVAEPLINDNRFSYRLDVLAQHYLGYGKVDEALDAYLIEKYGKKNPKGNIWRAHADIVTPYAIGDVNHPLEIFAKQRAILEKEGTWDLFIMESKLIPMLHAMRKRGVAIDMAKTEGMLKRGREEQAQLQAVLGADVSVWAAGDLAPIFDANGIVYPLTPKTKKPSITKELLDRIDHPIGRNVLEIRRIDKMCGTFLEGSLLNAHYQGRVHCNFNQLKGESGGAVSGRFSSSQPNLQFIPVRTEEGKLLRSCFIPDKGKLWYKIDYSQIEYRLIVHDAAQQGMRGAQGVADQYKNDPTTDFHDVVAKMVFGPDADKEDRRKAKTINFGLAYGEGKEKLARSLGLSMEEGEALLQQYHSRAPFIKPLSDRAMNLAQSTGLVTTLLQRRRRFETWEKRSRDKETGEVKTAFLPHRVPGSKRAFTYAALNARIQGSAADVMKQAMVDIWESGVCDEIGVPQLTVHDELDGSFEPTPRGLEAVREIGRLMERCLDKFGGLLVPLKADIEVGLNWGDCSTLTADSMPIKSVGKGNSYMSEKTSRKRTDSLEDVVKTLTAKKETKTVKRKGAR